MCMNWPLAALPKRPKADIQAVLFVNGLPLATTLRTAEEAIRTAGAGLDSKQALHETHGGLHSCATKCGSRLGSWVGGVTHTRKLIPIACADQSAPLPLNLACGLRQKSPQGGRLWEARRQASIILTSNPLFEFRSLWSSTV